MARISGNDIASFQGDINYDVYKDNSHFVIMKATEGVGFKDSKLDRNRSEARRVGMPLGFYHFARPDLNADPIKEADYFLSIIGQLNEGEVVALDYETPKKQADVEWCKKWLDYVFSKLGFRPLIYMSESYVTGLDWTAVVNGGYGLWIAKYLYNPTPDAQYNTGKWPFAAIYQWTSSQKVPGIPVEKVDGDVFYGDQATFKKYGYKKPTPPPPPVNWEQKYNEEVVKNKELDAKLTASQTHAASLQDKIDKAKADLA